MTTACDIDDQASDASLTSLASTYETVTTLPPAMCGIRDPYYLIDLRTQRPYAVRCRRNKCDWCLPINARRRALAMTAASPQRMIRLSLVAGTRDRDPLDTARTRIKRVRQALKRMGVLSGEWCWTMEVNPAGTGYHAHAVQHGPYISQAQLQTACERGGAGIPYINAIKTSPSRTSRYGLKAFGATGYGLKTYRTESTGREALALNHNRLEHHTPGFFTINGERMAPRQAEQYAIREIYGEGFDSFIIVPAKVARFYLSEAGRHLIPRPVPRWSDKSTNVKP